MNSFSDYLIMELNKRGWSQADLARASRLSTAVISNLINNKRNPGKTTCSAIAHAFRVPKEEVYRAAGLLDEIIARDKVMEILAYRASLLDARQLDELLKYADFIRERDRRE